MNCQRYERFLYLFREGELESREQRMLEAHLWGCPRCSATLRVIQKDSSSLEGVRRMSPRPEDPDKLTRRILESLPDAIPPPSGSVARLLDALVLWVERPIVRYASVVVVAGATLLFLVQQATLFLSLQGLEHRMALRPSAVSSPAVQFRVSKDDAHALAEAGIPGTAYQAFLREDGSVEMTAGKDAWPSSVLDHLIALRSLEIHGTDVGRLREVVAGLRQRTHARMTLLDQGG
jgi:hypothetical protein